MTETIDTTNLRALAEANKAWMKSPAAWIVPGAKGVAFFGSVLDGEKYEIGQVDTDNYYQEPAALPLAQFIAAANPAAIIALLDRLAAAEARNATLTDDAARAMRNRDMWKDQCAAQAATLATVTPLVQELCSSLENLLAEVRGECPALLDEDRGGSAYLGMDADDSIAAARAFLSGATKESTDHG